MVNKKDSCKFLTQLLFVVSIIMYNCGVTNNKEYLCHGTNYEANDFLTFVQDSFLVDGLIHHNGGSIRIPLPKASIIDVWHKSGTAYYKDQLNIIFKRKSTRYRLSMSCTSWGRNDYENNPEYLRENGRNIRINNSKMTAINLSKKIPTYPFVDSDQNKKYDLFVSKDSTYVKKVFIWMDSVSYFSAAMNLSLFKEGEDKAIKYGTKEYEFFKTCMLDKILFHFSENRRDSINAEYLKSM